MSCYHKHKHDISQLKYNRQIRWYLFRIRLSTQSYIMYKDVWSATYVKDSLAYYKNISTEIFKHKFDRLKTILVLNVICFLEMYIVLFTCKIDTIN